MSLISKKISAVKPSPTLAVNAKAAELKAQGVDIISLSAGEPDFGTPQNVCEAAKKAIDDGQTRYTNATGTPELKKAIQQKFLKENNIQYELSEIIVGCGGKHVLYNIFMASINEGDEVIIPAPYWVSYPAMVDIAGGKSVIVKANLDQGFKITAQDLESAITEKTKWLILNSPNNPTGATYSASELKALGKVLARYPNVYILSDDIYEHMVYDGEFATIASTCPDLKERVFTMNGVSKAYAMTGWRIGYGAGPKDLVKAMGIVQSQSTSNPSSISQAAAIEALSGTQEFIKPNQDLFKKRRDMIVKMMNKIAGIECITPEGAFYVFPSIQACIGKTTPQGNIINNSSDFATYLLESANVAVVPGIAFGLEGYIRISYATSEELLTESCERIAKACAELK